MMPLMMSQHLTFLLSAIMVCVFYLHGNPARAQEDMVSDTDELEISTEHGGDEVLHSHDLLADKAQDPGLQIGTAPVLHVVRALILGGGT